MNWTTFVNEMLPQDRVKLFAALIKKGKPTMQKIEVDTNGARIQLKMEGHGIEVSFDA